MDSEKVYLSMLGELVYPLRDIPNAFGPGAPCEKLYQQIYESKRRLCNRLNADEDPDVQAIGDCFGEINRVLCLQMYRPGTARDPKN